LAPNATELRGFKQLRRVAELLRFLHDEGCARDKAGNRELHFDDYVLLVLLFMFNPMIDSMRQLQRVADLETVQKKLGIERFSLGSFSESCRVFDPARLQQVIAQLAGELRPVGRREMFKDLPHLIELVDGTVIDTLRTVTEAMYLPLTDGTACHAWKLHLNFDVDHHVPAAWDLTDARGRGDSDERSVLRKRLAPGRTYVMDRGYAQFSLFNDIHEMGSSYVCRIRDNTSPAAVHEDRPLSNKDIQSGVLSDRVVTLGKPSALSGACDHKVRIVSVEITPHQKRGRTGGGTAGPASDGVLRIATDLLDAPAHVIAFLYEYRWTLEVFIRFFKQTLGCRHLLSTKPEGIQIQVYAAVISCMLLNILTGKKPGKWMVTLMSLYLSGWASEAEVLRELNKPDNTGVKLRAKEELWKKLGG
jgi:Transposase DDE domain